MEAGLLLMLKIYGYGVYWLYLAYSAAQERVWRGTFWQPEAQRQRVPEPPPWQAGAHTW